MNPEILIYLAVVAILFLSSVLLYFIPLFGKLGEKIVELVCHAPGLDLVLAYFMIVPLVVGWFGKGWSGVGVALAAQFSALWLWIAFHELIESGNRPKTTIHQALGKITGGWRNHFAVWITALAIPLFWMVRLTEVTVYPLLTWSIGLPEYQTRDWVNVSRHKFQGLIGYDLIWCLYCDWMTGVWSLGTEMLRNVESFWCPIRFDDEKKCENCQIDFPDLSNGWVDSNAEIEDVVKLLDCKYSKAERHQRSWFGHSLR